MLSNEGSGGNEPWKGEARLSWLFGGFWSPEGGTETRGGAETKAWTVDLLHCPPARSPVDMLSLQK